MPKKAHYLNSLTERSAHILKLLVEKHIENGQPVGSKSLVGEGLALSPATVRNVLADLEARGYLQSPHTSAGRVPTTEGYRLFVDHLLTASEVDLGGLEQMKKALSSASDAKSIAESASKIVSDMTQLTGIVMLPGSHNDTLKQIDFLPLNSRQVLVVLVINEKEVQNHIIDTEREYNAIELNEASNYLKQNFAGKRISDIRNKLLSMMEKEKQHMTKVMETAIQMSSKALERSKSEDSLVIKGESHLLGAGEQTDLPRLKDLFEAFSRKKDIIDLLDRCSQSNQMQIFIGKESGNQLFQDLSLISAPYTVGEEIVGVLAVVGPRRIPYQRVIPAVNITAKILDSVLNQTH